MGKPKGYKWRCRRSRRRGKQKSQSSRPIRPHPRKGDTIRMQIPPGIKDTTGAEQGGKSNRTVTIKGINSRPPVIQDPVKNSIEVAAQECWNRKVNKINTGGKKGITIRISVGGVNTGHMIIKSSIREFCQKKPAIQFNL